nr:hypothetical protein Itr_chr06CG19050 [Ipomoea trifida]
MELEVGKVVAFILVTSSVKDTPDSVIIFGTLLEESSPSPFLVFVSRRLLEISSTSSIMGDIRCSVGEEEKGKTVLRKWTSRETNRSPLSKSRKYHPFLPYG